MGRHCSYPGCKSHATKKGNTCKFVSFPKCKRNPEQAKRWSDLCQIRVEDVKPHTFICSLHFPANSVLNLRENPVLEPFSSLEGDVPVPAPDETGLRYLEQEIWDNKEDEEPRTYGKTYRKKQG